MSFLSQYFDVVEGAKEAAVCCPFPHYTAGGMPYYETNPSAHINLFERLYHCKVCQQGYNEAQFIQEIFGCNYMAAKKIQRCFESPEDFFMWNKNTTLSEESKQLALNLGISKEVINELNLKTPTGTTNQLCFPVFLYNQLADVRTYNPEGKPKVKSRANCPVGLIIPFDQWKHSQLNRVTLICAGEKDMAVARSQGFNAITITGGESTLPLIKNHFKDRKVAIVYDNDGTGIQAANKLAKHLYQYTQDIKIVTNFHEVCCQDKEDITDFFTKYQKTKQDLIKYIDETPLFVPSEEDYNDNYPIMDLLTASNPKNINKIVRSNIQVVATSEASFAAPSGVLAKKYKISGDKDTMPEGDFREWELTEQTCGDILHMVDNNFKEETVRKNIKHLLKIPHTERNVRVDVLTKKTVFKNYITDMFETTDTSVTPMEYTAYSIGQKLESGKKYLVTYKLVPHPYKGQQLTMIIINAVQANDSVSNFTITPETKKHLDVFRNLEGSVEERINNLTERIKSFLGYDGNNTLIQSIDLPYHTVLQFNLGSFQHIRGYLDTLIIGESRVGKSSTADMLRKLYELGVFTSLSGNSATVPGLIGGSNKTSSGYQTRAGVIPQNHKGLIIFEEFGKSNSNIVAELTDIRSSNEVRITRVSGTLTLPAMVRMITLSNVKAVNGTIKPIASYPHGLAIILELVDTAEDIARYDLMIVLPDQGASQIDPFWEPLEPFDQEVYKTRIRWIWSRSPEQVLINKEVGLHIIEQANKLNETYSSHIKIFGTEAWKKLARLSIAIAGYLVSTDDTYENIIVTKEHVDFAVKFFINIYDNPTFKLKEYVEHERKFVEVDEDAVSGLQDIYDKHPSLILQLEQSSSATKNMLGAASGLTNDELNKALNRLTKGLFIRFDNYNIIPTERFRRTLTQVDKDTYVKRLGEI